MDEEILTTTPEENPEQPPEDWREGLKYLLIPALVVVILLKVIFSLYYIPSSSMEPTLHEGSLQLGWRFGYIVSSPEPERGDIVVFKTATDTRTLVKRVVGVGGDQITISGGVLYLNGQIASEPYLADGTYTSEDGTYNVPEGKLLLLGDNRENSLDARYWSDPYVDVEDVKARILFH